MPVLPECPDCGAKIHVDFRRKDPVVIRVPLGDPCPMCNNLGRLIIAQYGGTMAEKLSESMLALYTPRMRRRMARLETNQ